MSRNICSSFCPHCGHQFRLTDFIGKTLEFRRYGPYPPVMGARLDCPCGEVYFGYMHTKDKFWADPQHAFEEVLYLPNGEECKNKDVGRFVVKRPGFPGQSERLEQTGCFTIDLSYYESYNDEHDNEPYRSAVLSEQMPPRHLCTDNAEAVEWPWGEHYKEKENQWEKV